jgi:uncharacterized protein
MAGKASGARAASMITLLAVMLAGVACTDSGTRSQPGATGSGSVDSTTLAGDTRVAIDASERYWKDQFTQRGKTFQPISRIIPYTTAGEVACGSEPMGNNNAAYCADGDFIAFDAAWAKRAYDKIGDAFIYYLLGHEYAHGIQTRLGGQYRYTIEQELQADCMAGAMIGDSIKNGQLQLEDGDIQELKSGLIAVADQPGQPWFAEGSHGTAEQRSDAFFAGYNGSVDACRL